MKLKINNFFIKDKEKKLEIKRIRTKLKKIIYHKFELKDKIEDK
jgi:uncharacterized protein YbcI